MTNLDITEQLYTGKIMMLVFSFFNILINLFAIYALTLAGLMVFALLSAVVFGFNIVFFAMSLKNWKKTPDELVQ